MNDVENLRKRAKQVLRDHRSGMVTVAERLRRGLPRFEGMTDPEVLDAPFALHDAQQLIASELGFASWANPADDELLAARFEVDDVKALFLELRDKGATILRGLRREPWDQVTFVARDPDGNLLSFGSTMP